MKEKTMRNILVAILISIFVPFLLFAGDQSAAGFVKSIHGIGSLLAASRTKDGNYLIASANSKITVMKLSPSGTKLWKTSFRDHQYFGLQINRIAEVSDGYVLVGNRGGGWYESDAMIMKLDASG